MPIPVNALASARKAMGSEFFRGGVAAIALKGAYIAAHFSTGVLLARALGVQGFGTYAFVLAIVQVLVILGQWGMPALLLRRIAIDTQAHRLDDVKPSLANSLTLSGAMAVLFGSLWAISAHVLGSFEPPVGGLIVVMVFAVVLGGVMAGALRGFGCVGLSLAADETLRPWLFLAGLATALATGLTLDPHAAVALHTAAAVCALITSALLLRRTIPRDVWAVKTHWQLTAFARLGLPFALLAGAQTLSYQIDTIMLGIMTPGAPVGLYRSAAQIAEGVSVILFAISTVIAPHLARAGEDIERLREILINAHRLAVALLMPPVLLVVFAGDFIIETIFGAPYLPAAEAMHILVIGKLFYAGTGLVGLGLSMTGYAWAAALIAGGMILVNVVLDLVAIPLFGIEGAAMADTTSNFLLNLASALYLQKMLGGRGVTALASKSRH